MHRILERGSVQFHKLENREGLSPSTVYRTKFLEMYFQNDDNIILLGAAKFDFV